MSDFDAYAPREIAQRVETVGVAKAGLGVVPLLLLSVLAGAFISLGSLFYAVTITGSELGFGPTRFVGGLAFSLGLILVVVAGAELFTGNNLLAMAWISRKITTRALLRNWLLVYFGNVVGALLTVGFAHLGEVERLGNGAVGETLRAIAHHKVQLGAGRSFVLGVLCNALVCLAVWLSLAARSVTDKILGIVFPVSAFVAMGFEHCIANWFLLPYGALFERSFSTGYRDGQIVNLLFSTLGNLVGGTFLVAGVYWTAYLRRTP
ncbi:MAG: formate/nitrite transporter family protein [Planctomycetes bacterium]|nr:formate/nitrite transporter family protein [Planctomycetota bacterium]